ncbi:MAG: hypothetical protein R2867_16205 [Caldilineaceae bacterium]
MEAAAVAGGMLRGGGRADPHPTQRVDVLAQQIVALVAGRSGMRPRSMISSAKPIPTVI